MTFSALFLAVSRNLPSQKIQHCASSKLLQRAKQVWGRLHEGIASHVGGSDGRTQIFLVWRQERWHFYESRDINFCSRHFRNVRRVINEKNCSNHVDKSALVEREWLMMKRFWSFWPHSSLPAAAKPAGWLMQSVQSITVLFAFNPEWTAGTCRSFLLCQSFLRLWLTAFFTFFLCTLVISAGFHIG